MKKEVKTTPEMRLTKKGPDKQGRVTYVLTSDTANLPLEGSLLAIGDEFYTVRDGLLVNHFTGDVLGQLDQESSVSPNQ